MKKLFFLFLLLIIGVGSLSAKTNPEDKKRLEEAFNWHLTPGSYEEKQYAIQNPGDWIRVADEKKLGSQRNEWGIRKEGVLTIVRLICYDEQEKKFLCEERVSNFKEEDNGLSWITPFVALLGTFVIGGFLVYLFSAYEEDYRPYIIITTIACVVSVMIAWYYNWVIMWSEIIIIMSVILAYTIPYLLDILKKKKRIKK